jgi:hypothetical protein
MRIFICLLSCALAWSVSGAELNFNFNSETEGSTPTNFASALLGGGPPPVWKIVADEVPSAFRSFNGKTTLMNHALVLAQTSEDKTDERYPMFIYQGQSFRDFSLKTQFKIVSGTVEQMAGVVFRFQNASNYYIVRISALGTNVCFYKMINGQIVSPIKFPLAIAAGTWHTLQVDCSGIYISCLVDGQKVLPTISDASPPDGKLGFWTMSDSITHFTGTTVTYTPLIPVAQQIVNSVMADESRLLGLRLYVSDATNSTRIIASKDPAENCQAGADEEWQAIHSNTISSGHERGAVIFIMPLHDRNGEDMAAVYIKMKSFWGETQDSALTRAMMVQKKVEVLSAAAGDLLK